MNVLAKKVSYYTGVLVVSSAPTGLDECFSKKSKLLYWCFGCF